MQMINAEIDDKNCKIVLKGIGLIGTLYEQK